MNARVGIMRNPTNVVLTRFELRAAAIRAKRAQHWDLARYLEYEWKRMGTTEGAHVSVRVDADELAFMREKG